MIIKYVYLILQFFSIYNMQKEILPLLQNSIAIHFQIQLAENTKLLIQTLKQHKVVSIK